MSITFTSGRQFNTSGAVTLLDNASSFSISYFFRYDGNPASASFWEFLSTRYKVPLLCRFNGNSSASSVGMFWGLRNAAFVEVSTSTTISKGLVYHVALTYDQGAQAYYINGVPTAYGSFTGNIYSVNQGWLLGSSGGASDLAYSLNSLGVWRNRVLTQSEIVSLRDGVKLPTDLGATAYWPLSTPGKGPGDTVALGDAGLADANGNASLRFSAVTGSGTAVYSDAMPFAPGAACVATVGTSGRTVYIRFISKADGSGVSPGAVYAAPTIALNGASLGQLTGLVLTGYHDGVMYQIPGGAKVNPGDLVTLSAPIAWANTSAGVTESMGAQACVNRSGQSYVRDEAAPRTMKLGYGFGHLVTPEWSNYVIGKNLRYKIPYWNPSLVAADSKGKPTKISGTVAIAPIHYDTVSNLIDNTGYPAPAGLYAVRWDVPPSGTTVFGLRNAGGGDDTIVTERTDLANPGVNGVGKVRVFNFQPGPSGNPIRVWLQLSDPSSQPQFDNLTILGPGEFDYQAGVPTVLPPVAATETAASFKRRVPTSMKFGPLRWLDATIFFPTGTSMCEPEHLIGMDDWTWAQRVKQAWTVRFTQARPWSNANSPYIYSTLFGSPFDATLAAPITSTPAAGTQEVITISDAATAPVLEGLKLRAGDEIMRVMAVSGTSVTVERGSDATTPAAHPAGTVQVLNRFPVAGLAAFGPYNQQVTELVTQSPHRLRTGQMPAFDGTGWPAFTYTDSRPFTGTWFRYYKLMVFVTGANSFVVIGDGPNDPTRSLPNTTLSTTYTLDPNNCYYQIYLPEYGGVPFEFTAQVTGQYPDTPLWVNIPQAASDALVDAIARRVRDNFPAGRTVYLELSDEPWNFATPVSRWFFYMDWFVYGQVGTQTRWCARRTGQVKQRFVNIFNERGLNRGGELKSILNIQTTAAGNVPSLLAQAASEGMPIDVVAIAPYYSIDGAPSITTAFNSWDMDQLVDLWIFDVYYNTSSRSQVPKLASFRSTLDAWNAANGTNVDLLIYEYSPEIPWPVHNSTLSAAIDATTTTIPLSNVTNLSAGAYLRCGSEWMLVQGVTGLNATVARGQSGTTAAAQASGASVRNAWIESVRDLANHPNFRTVDKDTFALFQKYGVKHCVLSSFSQHYDSGHLWGTYHALAQEPGPGDGSGGSIDNLLTLARPGQARTKAAKVNLDINTVNVRGQACLDWNKAAAPARRLKYIPRTQR